MSSNDQSTGQTNSAASEESSTIQTPVEDKVEEISKYSIRKQVWTNFEKNGLLIFPLPVWGRIPNFEGADEVAAKLAELDVFKNASYISVNLDKPQENVRLLALQNKKKLLVPAPRMKEAVFLVLKLSRGGRWVVKQIGSRQGMRTNGDSKDIETDIKIDLVVVGSVAVSREGHRVGKGEGFADLKFAILAEIGAITKDTVVATTVHDSQVFDTLPHSLFKEHDVPVDIIVTPTEVIHVKDRLPKPEGVIWSILSQRKMNTMAILRVLREKSIANGKECQLKADGDDSETERTRRGFYPVPKFARYAKKGSSVKSDGVKATEERKSGLGDKMENKKLLARLVNEFMRGAESNSEAGMRKQKRGYVRRRRFHGSSPIQFSLRIGNISSNVRVRDLKNALAERNVKPTDITWRGHKGFAFIHFAKPKEGTETPALVDNIVASLQDMKIGNDKEGVTLLVEAAKPMARTEAPSPATDVPAAV